MKVKYIEKYVAEHTVKNSIKNAYDRNTLSILASEDCWYMEECPNRIYNTVKKEMKRLFPHLPYLYDVC